MKFILLCVILLLTACYHGSHEKKDTVALESHPLTTSLYYSGIIQPIKTTIITTPTDGVISDMTFHYGDVVTQDKSLFVISSDKFQADYKNALMAYIKAKTDFTNNQMQLHESEFLHKNKLISDDDYKAKQSNFFNAQLALIQAKDALTIYLKEMDLKGLDIFSLSIENIDKIDELLHQQNTLKSLHISSPATGIVLLPSESSTDNSSKKIAKGDQVKQGDVLAMIGDMSGLIIHINVNELNINQLKIGQRVTVTGPAFPDMELQGSISGIDRQGEVAQGGAPVFSVDIVVPSLTPAQQKIIHVGMSAKVAVQLEENNVMTVPIAAVFEENGSTYVNAMLNGKIQQVRVETGQTTQDSVVIKSSLKPGDHIVITN